MERVSDEQLDSLFVFFKPFKGSIAKHLELALTELRERREAEVETMRHPEPYDAEWVEMRCPKCGGSFVCVDKLGHRCVVDGCGWTKPHDPDG